MKILFKLFFPSWILKVDVCFYSYNCRVNLHGVFLVQSANLVETKEVEEEVPMEVEPPAAKKEGEASPEKQPPAASGGEAGGEVRRV